MPQDTAFLEPFYVEDKVVAGLAMVDELAPNLFRVMFYSEQRGLYCSPGEKERTIVAKFVMTADTMKALARALDAAGKGLPEIATMPAASAFN